MPTRLGLIIFLVYAAIHVISAIAQHRKKEQERRAAMEAAEQRRIMAEQPGGAANVATQSPPPTTPVVSGDVEARRQAQLEQLRQRRDGRRQGVAIASPSPGPLRTGAPRSGISQSRPAPALATPFGTSDQARMQAQEAERRERDQQRQRREQAARAAAQNQAKDERAQQKVQAARERMAAEAARQEAAAVQAARPAGRTDPEGRPVALAQSLINRLRDPASVREAMILLEVLDRPVALRTDRT